MNRQEGTANSDSVLLVATAGAHLLGSTRLALDDNLTACATMRLIEALELLVRDGVRAPRAVTQKAPRVERLTRTLLEGSYVAVCELLAWVRVRVRVTVRVTLLQGEYVKRT